VVSGTPAPGQPAARWIVWETTKLPDAVRTLCEATPFVWTASTWGYRNLAANGVPKEKLAAVPMGVDTDFFRPAGTRPRDSFRFLFVGKWETRKFIDGLARAFTEEFTRSEDVELVLHAHNSYVPGFSLHGAIEGLNLRGRPRIVASDQVSHAGLLALYQSADCFVCPTRAEGFGLPILEAMACGVPAIVTRYSAPVDFVSEANGYLIDVERMVDAHCDIFDIHTGQWAEPSVPHLRALMRAAVNDREALRARGEQAARDAQRWSWREVARIALEAIRTSRAI
jgi:glycosyltransferase involved in cell wall biosynthesis